LGFKRDDFLKGRVLPRRHFSRFSRELSASGHVHAL
jgi:hypothetical protein